MEIGQQYQIWRTLALVGSTVALLLMLRKVLSWVRDYWLTPMKLQRIMRRQGVRGPPYRPVVGNMLEMVKLQYRAATLEDAAVGNYDTISRVAPIYVHWSKVYRDSRFIFWWGYEPRMTVTEPELVKEILSSKFGHFEKSSAEEYIMTPLMGKGLVTVRDGEEWALQRRTVTPAFHIEALKGMVEAIVEGAAPMMERWKQNVSDGGGSAEFEVSEDLVLVTADIIARTLFGSSYKEGKKVFDYLHALSETVQSRFLNPLIWIPGYSLLPTASNRKLAELQNGIRKDLTDIIQSRLQDSVSNIGGRCDNSYGNDLLGLMLSAAVASKPGESSTEGTKAKFGMQALIDNCKSFYFAGHETTSMLLKWTIMLLAAHPEWQERAREEVFDVWGVGEPVEASMLRRMKIVGMVLNETLRLFPALPMINRVAAKDMQLGDLFIPKGLGVQIVIIHLHRDPKIWGKDVMEFNPGRFADGVAKACNQAPCGFLPFSYGPRVCIGQTFALNETKLILAMVLQRFRFSLSPSYRHCPEVKITQHPKYGVPLILHSLKSSA